MTKVYYLNHLISKFSFGPELQYRLEKTLKNQNYNFTEYKIEVKKAASIIKKDATDIYDMRANEGMSINALKKIRKF